MRASHKWQKDKQPFLFLVCFLTKGYNAAGLNLERHRKGTFTEFVSNGNAK